MLSSKEYLLEEVFQLEKEKIFSSSWQYVGSGSFLREPGSYFSVEVAGEPIVVVRDSQEKLRALSRVCRHRAGIVGENRGCVSRLQCPYHGWTYQLDGTLHTTPEFGKRIEGELSLPEFEVKQWGSLVFIRLENKKSHSWDNTFGKIETEVRNAGVCLSDYRNIYRRDYVVDCNWKVYLDNYLEGYHIPFIHPALNREIDYSAYEISCHGDYIKQQARLGKLNPQIPRRYQQSGGQLPLYYWVFPNFMINIYPDNISLNLVVPLSRTKTLTVFEWLSTDGDFSEISEYFPLTQPLPKAMPIQAEALEELTQFSHQVQLEDIAVCEQVQCGLASRYYDRGELSPKHERGVGHFHQLWERSVSQS